MLTEKDYLSRRDDIKFEFYDHLQLREGFVDTVYLDTLGYKTVGVGHKLTEEECEIYNVGDKWDTESLTKIFHRDADKAFNQAEFQAGMIGQRWNPVLVTALASVCFQLGNSWNTVHKKTWNYLMENDFVGAAKEAEDSRWFKQTPVRVRDFQRALIAVEEMVKY